MELVKPVQHKVVGDFDINKVGEKTVVVVHSMIMSPTGPQVIGTATLEFRDPQVAKVLAAHILEAAERVAGQIVVPVGRNGIGQ